MGNHLDISSGSFEFLHHHRLHLLGHLRSIVSLLKTLSQLLSGFNRRLHHFWLFGHMRNDFLRNLNPFTVEKIGDTYFTGLAITSGKTASGTLSRNFGHRFNEVVKKKLLYLIRRVVTFSTPNTNCNSQLSSKEITFLVSELKPPLQEGMGRSVHP